MRRRCTPLQSDRHTRRPFGVIGLGHVGLPLALDFARAGFDVLGIDTDPERVAALGRGETPLAHLGADFARELGATRRFEATGDARRLAEVADCALCVPTSVESGAFGRARVALEPLRSVAAQLARSTAPAHEAVLARSTAPAHETVLAGSTGPARVVLVCSTAPPGTARSVVAAELERAGAVVGRDVFVAAAPSREDPGRSRGESFRVPRLCGGVDAASGQRASALLARVYPNVVPCASAEVAEAAKLWENAYRLVNAALANELADLCARLGLDARDVVGAAATKPFGFERFDPGPGAGGPCVPAAARFLAVAAERAAGALPLVELAERQNALRPAELVERAAAELRARGRGLDGARVLVVGVGYKRGAADLRGSPGVALLRELRARGADACYADPLVPELELDGRRLHSRGPDAVEREHYELVIGVSAGRQRRSIGARSAPGAA